MKKLKKTISSFRASKNENTKKSKINSVTRRVDYLAFWNNEKLPISKKELPKLVKICAQHQINPKKNNQRNVRLFQSGKISANLVTLILKMFLGDAVTWRTKNVAQQKCFSKTFLKARIGWISIAVWPDLTYTFESSWQQICLQK